jgi:hypothetical protein
MMKLNPFDHSSANFKVLFNLGSAILCIIYLNLCQERWRDLDGQIDTQTYRPFQVVRLVNHEHPDTVRWIL